MERFIIGATVGIILLALSVATYITCFRELERQRACNDLVYGQYYTTLTGFYRNQSLLAIRYNGGTSASFLILPDNGQIDLKCQDVIELDVN